MKNAFYTLVGLIFIIGSVVLFLNKPVRQFTVINIGSKNITAEVVDTPNARKQGLSGRESLKDGSGMLFVFEKPDFYGFWMKDMHFAIDMIWIDENKHVVNVSKGVSPETFPQTFSPQGPVLYVLEVPAGFSDEEGIDTGSVVSFDLEN